MQNEIEREDIEKEVDFIISELENFFGDKIDGYELDLDNDYPMVGFDIKFTLYNYFRCKVAYGVSKLGFYLFVGGGTCIVSRCLYTDINFPEYLSGIDKEIRLRIPDKYLIEKWP